MYLVMQSRFYFLRVPAEQMSTDKKGNKANREAKGDLQDDDPLTDDMLCTYSIRITGTI